MRSECSEYLAAFAMVIQREPGRGKWQNC